MRSKKSVLVSLAALAGGLALLAGCSGAPKRSPDIPRQPQPVLVTFDTNPSGAHCEITQDGSWILDARTPSEFWLDMNQVDLRVLCRKPGYQTQSITITKYFHGWNGNFLVVPLTKE